MVKHRKSNKRRGRGSAAAAQKIMESAVAASIPEAKKTKLQRLGAALKSAWGVAKPIIKESRILSNLARQVPVVGEYAGDYIHKQGYGRKRRSRRRGRGLVGGGLVC